MTKAPPEVLATMEATTIKPQGITLSRLSAGLLVAGALVAVVAAALVAYALAPCRNNDFAPERFSVGSGSPHSQLYVRLPTSVKPISYKVRTYASG